MNINIQEQGQEFVTNNPNFSLYVTGGDGFLRAAFHRQNEAEQYAKLEPNRRVLSRSEINELLPEHRANWVDLQDGAVQTQAAPTENVRLLTTLVIEQAERNGFDVEVDAIRETVDEFCKVQGISASEAERAAACAEAERQWADRRTGEPANLASADVRPIGMTDAEVVQGAERMARVLLKAWGFKFSGEAVRNSRNPRAISAWQVVSAMLEEYNGTDLSSAVDFVDCCVQEIAEPATVAQAATRNPLELLRNALCFNELGKRHESAEAISAAMGMLSQKRAT